jgi:MoaA/NifB/PqqE/SkfB family radical SAM enzyme
LFLHIEISSKCALQCPSCPRTNFLGKFKVGELSLQAIKNSIHPDRKYEIISLCGDHGDPIYHTQFHEVIEILKTVPGRPPIHIATNGSFRSKEWWEKTAQILGKRDRVIFGIDGTRETNHLYRRGSDWDSIMLGLQTLLEFGQCQVHWQWILFKYNQTQLLEGQRLARQLGVHRFFVVESARTNDDLQATVSLEEALEGLANG